MISAGGKALAFREEPPPTPILVGVFDLSTSVAKVNRNDL